MDTEQRNALGRSAPNEASDDPYSIVASSLVRDMKLPFEAFAAEVVDSIARRPKDAALIVFPEYCWRTTPVERVLAFVETLRLNVPQDLVLVLGTVDTAIPGSPPGAKPTNTALVLGEGELRYVPKTKVLDTDRANGVVPGENPGVLRFARFRLAVLVCADLWDVRLCYRLAHVEKAEVFVVPAWTATQKGNRTNARKRWDALAATRSKEYGIVVAVADHVRNFERTDVANATRVFLPTSGDEPRPDDVREYAVRIEPEEIRACVERWNRRGLGQ